MTFVATATMLLALVGGSVRAPVFGSESPRAGAPGDTNQIIVQVQICDC